MPVSFATEPASRRQRAGIGLIALTLVATAAAAMVWADLPLVPVPAFLPAFATMVSLTGLLTAYLLAAQFRITRLPAMLMLASAYLYSGLIVIPQTLTFPGVAAPDGLLGAGEQSAVWLWVSWHGGFALLVLAYAVSAGWGEKSPMSPHGTYWASLLAPAGVCLLVVLLTALATRGQTWLPALIVRGNYRPLMETGIGGIVLGCNALTLATVLAVTRCRSIGQLGLALAVLANLLDVMVSLTGQARFSLGWYVARVNSILAASAVLAVFLYEIVWLYHRLAEFNATLSRLAFIDELTGLANRRQFEQRLMAEWARAQRDGTPLSLLILDVDFFKKFNDRYGHPAGDACLRRVAQAIGGTIRRPGDLAARYGGEEFAAILPETPSDGAAAVAQAILEAVLRQGISHQDGTPLGIVTVSIGLATSLTGEADTPDALKERADKALYLAKNNGRNRLSVFPAVPSHTAPLRGSRSGLA